MRFAGGAGIAGAVALSGGMVGSEVTADAVGKVVSALALAASMGLTLSRRLSWL
jgi:hypothetical protein